VALVRVPFYFINLLPTSLLYISILLARERGSEGGRKGGREGGREEREREGERERWREGRKRGGRQGGREREAGRGGGGGEGGGSERELLKEFKEFSFCAVITSCKIKI
jgi:hypothetical protein